MKRLLPLFSIIALTCSALPGRSYAGNANVTTTITDFMSVYCTGSTTVNGSSRIPVNLPAMKGNDLPNFTYGNIATFYGNGAFSLHAQGFYEVTIGVCSKSGGTIGLFSPNSIGAPVVIPASKIFIPPGDGSMVTHSFIMRSNNASMQFFNFGPDMTLDGPTDCVTAILTLKKL